MEKAFDIIAIGTALVDSIIRGFDPTPISASGYRAESGSLNAGGEAVNAAVAAAKLGARVGILCSLGCDAAGDLIADTLSRSGVCTDRILRSEAHPTPVTTMFVHPDGSRKSITNGAHRYNFHPERYPKRFTDARAILLGSLFRAPFDDPQIVSEVVSAAKASGTRVFADTKLPNFRTLTLHDLKDALPLIDCITPNEDEARYYTGCDEPEQMAKVFLDYGVRQVIIKLGAKGCYYRSAAEAILLPALPVHAVDATGAGDNFLAGFATELLRERAPLDALRFANACGAICTTAVGAGTALQNREQVLSYL